MTGAGLFPGDTARSCWLIDGEFTIKRYCIVSGGNMPVAENLHFMNIEISAGTGFEVLGVVKHAIPML